MHARTRLRRALTIVSGTALTISLTLGGAPSAAAVVSHLVTNDVTQRVPAGQPLGHIFSCQTDRGPNAIVCYSPAQIQVAYGVDKLLSRGITGRGRTIAIIDAFQNPLMAQDLLNFDSVFGLPAPSFHEDAPDGLTPFDPTDANQVGWAAEIALDVQWARAIAPGAKIELVLAKSNNDADILSATEWAVRHNVGDVISQSFGENENCVDPQILKREHRAFAQAVEKGITLFASSGDQGAAQQTCDGTSWVQVASSPASDPLVTGVGGTELLAAPACRDPAQNEIPCPSPAPVAGTYGSEAALNEPPGLVTLGSFSTGGGFSDLYRRPDYQEGVRGIGSSTRGVPDVGYNGAIGHGVIASFAVGGGFFIFGGTSAGSPQWAALTAMADQLAHQRVGNINPALYDLGRHGGSGAFHDITAGNNAVTEFDSSNNPVNVPGFAAGPRWDATTGLGTPKANVIVRLLADQGGDNGGN